MKTRSEKIMVAYVIGLLKMRRSEMEAELEKLKLSLACEHPWSKQKLAACLREMRRRGIMPRV